MSIYRYITWYMKGLKEYTKSGFETASKSFKGSDILIDLSNKVYMVTGANSGIGKMCTLFLAQRGATVHMVCRSKERGEEALTELKSNTKNDKLTLHLLDMSNPEEVYKFGKQFSSSGQQLDVLINNAGCMVNSLTMNADNLEINFATNTLGTYILTETLMDALRKSADPRVVVVSSGGMLVQKLDVSDINYEKRGEKSFDGTMSYAQTKRQQVIMTQLWSKKYDNVRFFSMHPGWADTPAVATSMTSFYERHKTKLRTAEQGADTILWLAISEAALSEPNGEFFQDRKVVPQHLPLAWTRSSDQENQHLMEVLDTYMGAVIDKCNQDHGEEAGK